MRGVLSERWHFVGSGHIAEYADPVRICAPF